MKTYASKSGAKKAAKRQGLNVEDLTFLQDLQGEDPNRWYWKEPVKEAAPVVEPGKGIKIEKDRPEQNGITKPSIGGKCRAIWDACDLMWANNDVPTVKSVRDLAAEKGWNVNNAVIEYYQWRKFHGLTGRQK